MRAHTIDGQSMAQLAGISEDDTSGMIFFMARRDGPMAAVLDKLHWEHVPCYLLLGKDQRVIGHYFVSNDDLIQTGTGISSDPR